MKHTLKPLYEKETRPLLEKEAAAFKIIFMDTLTKEENKQDLSALTQSGLYQILENRIEWLGLQGKISKHALMLISCLCESPGQIALWAHTLWEMCKTQETITILTFTDFFPNGIPTREAMDKAWDEQKHEGANLVDKPELYSMPSLATE